MRQLDQYMLLHHPHIWRTHTIKFLPCSAIGVNLLFYIIGSIVPINSNSTPTISEISSGFLGIQLLGALALSIWIYYCLRSPLGEWRARNYLIIGCLYFLTIFSVLTNPLMLFLPITQKIAESVSDEEFQKEYTTHSQFDFWCCNEEISEETISKNKKSIRDSLSRYGLTSKLDVIGLDNVFISGDPFGLEKLLTTREPGNRGMLCTNPANKCLWTATTEGELSPFLLKDRMQSVKAAKQLANGQGKYHKLYWLNLARIFFLCMIISSSMIAAGIPKHVWHRKFGHYFEESNMPELRLPQPKQLIKLDRRLLLKHPLIWSTRTHSFLFNTIIYGTLAGISIIFFLNLILPDFNIPNLQELFGTTPILILIISAGILLPGAWALRQFQIPLKGTTIAHDLRANFSYLGTMILLCCVATLPCWLFGLVPKGEILKLSLWILLGALLTTGFVYSAKYLEAPKALTILIIGTSSLGLQIISIDSLSATGLYLLPLWLSTASWLITHHQSSSTAHATVSCGFLLLLPSTISSVLFIFLTGGVPPEILTPSALFLSPLIYLGSVCIVSQRLRRYYYWPKN